MIFTQKETQYMCGAVLAVMEAGGSQDSALSKRVTELSKLPTTVAPGVAAGLKRKEVLITFVDKVPHVNVPQPGWWALFEALKIPENMKNTDSIYEYAKNYLGSCPEPQPVVKTHKTPQTQNPTPKKGRWKDPERKSQLFRELEKSAAGWVVEIIRQCGDISRDEAELFYCFQALAETAIKGMVITQQSAAEEDEPGITGAEMMEEQSLVLALKAIEGVGLNRKTIKGEV